jgi:iron complex outermembrane receptor protein
LGTSSVDNALTTDYTLKEDVVAPFLAGYYTTDRFRVIAGARYNITHFNDKTGRITNGTFSPFEFSRTYSYLLPNIQGYFDIKEGFRIRAAFTETTALIDFNNFAQGQATNFNFAGVQVTTGSNPDLKPKRSFNKDVSIEFYQPRWFFTAGYFQKTINNEVYNITQSIRDANGILLSTLQTPVNGPGAHVQGIELEGQWRDFTGLAPWLRGVTLDANLALFDSKFKPVLSDGSTRTINGFTLQPSYVANLILGYETGPFSATIAGMARGRAFNGFFQNPNADLYIAPYASLDAKASMVVWRDYKIYVQASNLTKSWWREVSGSDKSQLSSAIQPGRTFAIGASLNF